MSSIAAEDTTSTATTNSTSDPQWPDLHEAIAASNQIRPATRYTSTAPTAATKLRLAAECGDSGDFSATAPISIPAMMLSTCLAFPDTVALRFKRDAGGAGADGADAKVAAAEWQSVTFKEYHENVLQTARVFLKLGLEAHHSVGVLAFNSPEWFYAALGAVHAGGIIAGIYTTNSADAVRHVLHSSHANIVLVDDSKQMAKIHEIRSQLPLLKAAIQTQGPYADYVNNTNGYYRWSDLLADPQLVAQDALLHSRIADIRVNECCSLVYTSGTVGQPKGVMLNHDSLTFAAASVGRRLPNLNRGAETVISYLPLSHIAAQMIDTLVSVHYAVTVYFADKDALKGSLIRTLHEAKPTRFIGVPRVFEKIHEKMMSIAAQTTGIRKSIATWAKATTLQHWMDAIQGTPSDTFQYRAARYLIMSRIKEALGLGRCQTIVTAAAPMTAELKKYFLSIDLPILEVFGMSESSGPQCLGDLEHYNLDSIGRTIDGAETRLAPIADCAEGEGEILMRGRHVFMGYIDDEERTAEALDADGWLHSGDLGRMDELGFVYITGRLKELIITAGGENIPPNHIEALIRKELAALSNAFLVGDKRKFLTVLVSLKTEMDVETGEPRDELQLETRQWLSGLGLAYGRLSEVLAAGPCPKVLEAITAAISRANQHSISNAQKVQKFAILPHDFSVFTGELGPTLKVKRNVVAKKYADLIDGLYE